MVVLASYHIKGGVGKTATAVNLSYMAARSGLRTLVWDLDPQGSTTFYFRVKPKVKGGAKALIKGGTGLDGVIRGSDFELLDLVPADFSYRKMDLVLDRRKKPARALREMLSPVGNAYDVVILDCPPGVTLTSLAILYAADALVIPVIPTILSLETLRRLLRFLRKKGTLSDLAVLPFFSMADRRKNLHREIMENPPRDLGPFLDAWIPYAADVERMGTHRAPVGSFAGSSRSSRAYEELWAEIRERVFSSDDPLEPATETRG